MSKISTSSTGVRYLDNLVSLETQYDGICKSGYGRIFNGTQSVTFSSVATNSAYYMTYFNFLTLVYEQIQYSSQTFSTTGTFSNFCIWNRQLTNNELNFLNNNIEFILNNKYNYIDINGLTSIQDDMCLLWVPMLPSEGASVYDYVNKVSYTISNYDSNTLVSDSQYGPQYLAYSDTMDIHKYYIYIRDNIIETNWIPSSILSWTLEEVYDEKHIIYTYNKETSEFTKHINGELDSISTYTFTGTKQEINSTSFSGDVTNITTRWYYNLYNRLLDSTEITTKYLYFLKPDYCLTLDNERTIVTNNGIPLVYKPLSY